MKHWLAVLAITFGLLSSGGAGAAEKIVTLAIENMTCALCPLTVRKSLEAVEGVQAVKISLADETAVVTFDAEKTNIAALTAATTKAGYPSSLAQEDIAE
jgi:mercuric ion binding protein